jgi:hypothetical protein
MVPDDLFAAFYRIVLDLEDWTVGSPEPTAPIGREFYAASTICGFMSLELSESEEMPVELVDTVLKLKKVDPDLLLADRTFQAGASYVAEIIQGRKRAFDQVQRMTGRSKGD